jgi:hypothetical protein
MHLAVKYLCEAQSKLAKENYDGSFVRHNWTDQISGREKNLSRYVLSSRTHGFHLSVGVSDSYVVRSDAALAPAAPCHRKDNGAWGSDVARILTAVTHPVIWSLGPEPASGQPPGESATRDGEAARRV